MGARPRARVAGLLIGALLAIIWTPSAAAVQSATAVGLDLRRQSIRIHRLADGTLRYFDASRQLRVEPIDQFVQLLIDRPDTDPPPQTEQTPTASVLLIDGQRLVGTWVGAADNGESLQLRHAALGRIRIQLDRVKRFDPPGRAADYLSGRHRGAELVTPGPGAADQVALINGDVLEGFVAAIHTSAVSVNLAGGDEPIDVPLERVQSIRIANESQTDGPALDRVSLRDGSIVHASDLRIESDEQLTFSRVTVGKSDHGDVTLDLSSVARIDLGRSGLRLVDLHRLPRQVVAGGEVFGVPMPPRVKDGTLWMHAPVKVRFDLPAGAVRFAARAVLDAQGSDDASSWSDLIVKVAVGGNAHPPIHLHAAEPGADLSVATEGGILTIELDPALYGPVMDRILLRQAVVLVTKQP